MYLATRRPFRLPVLNLDTHELKRLSTQCSKTHGTVKYVITVTLHYIFKYRKTAKGSSLYKAAVFFFLFFLQPNFSAI